MRVLLTTFPAIGHLHAIAPFALAAHRAGHRICVATSPDLLPWSIACGMPTRAIGPFLRSLTVQGPKSSQGFPGFPGLAGFAGGAGTSDRMLTQTWPRAVLTDLTRLVEDWQPDLIVHEEGELAAVLVAARLGVPCVTHSWATPARSLRERADAVAAITPLWEQYVGPSAGAPTITGGLYLDSCPATFQLGGPQGVERVRTVRPEPFDGPPRPVASWLAELPRPTAYVTMGTDPRFSTPELLALLASAVAAEVGSVILTTGPHDPAVLGPLPGNVRAMPYLPQSHALARADVVVSQGGASGTIGALLRALPHLVLPGRSQSQQDVASVTAGIGAGLRLRREQIDPSTVRAAIAELLSDVRFELAASRVRRQIEALPDPAAAVESAVEFAVDFAG